MDESWTGSRDLAALVVPAVGRLMESGDTWEPYVLVDPAGARVMFGAFAPRPLAIEDLTQEAVM